MFFFSMNLLVVENFDLIDTSKTQESGRQFFFNKRTLLGYVLYTKQLDLEIGLSVRKIIP